MAEPLQRKLTTIMAADAVEFSRGMDLDEVGTTEALRRSRAVFFRLIAARGGRVVNTAGDGLIAEFPSVVEAVTCAIETQRELGRDEGALRFRIGIHLGDVIVDGDDLLGEGVNLAARLESMAEPGNILLSQQVYDQVRSKLTIGFEFIGERRPHNFEHDVGVYRITNRDESPTRAEAPRVPHDISPPVHTEESKPRVEIGTPFVRLAATLGILWAFLLVIDLASGGGFFAHWLALPVLAVLGFAGVPHFFRGSWMRWVARLAVLGAMLVAINLFTWNGNFWAVYPIAALTAAAVLRTIRRPES